jgi:formylglycine-generating enzyme
VRGALAACIAAATIVVACTAYEAAPEQPAPPVDASSVDAATDVTISDAPIANDAGDAGAPAGMVVVQTAGGARFAIDATEVTVGAFKQFRDTHPFDPTTMPAACSFKTSFGPDSACGLVDQDDLPIHCVDWCDGAAYCAANGKRLCGKIGGGAVQPTEATDPSVDQWTRACANGIDVNRWPHGNTSRPGACNTDSYDAGMLVPVGTLSSCTGGLPGLFDMSGNGYELEDNCAGATGASDECKLRGGAFNTSDLDAKCNSTYAKSRMSTARSISFRCCKDL